MAYQKQAEQYAISREEFLQRKESLESLYFHSYQDYLDSELWDSIRKKVMSRDKKLCKCGSRATQVHHKSYDLTTMKGKDLSKLVAICEECHLHTHFYREGVSKKPPKIKKVEKRPKKVIDVPVFVVKKSENKEVGIVHAPLCKCRHRIWKHAKICKGCGIKLDWSRYV